MKKELYDGLSVYLNLMENGKLTEQFTPEEMNAYTLVTKDEKMKKVLDSFEPGVIPSLVDIVPRYNKLCEEEKEQKLIASSEQFGQENLTPLKEGALPETASEMIKQAGMKKELKYTNKLNQVGYANVVLMSIIVIVIIAIICVFIFA